MATLDTDETNLIDAETVNWRLIVFPVVAVIVVGLAGLAFYYYQIAQRDQLEATARTALMAAKTPEDLLKVANDYPTSTQAALALIDAADQYFSKHDYPKAIDAYQKIESLPHPDELLLESSRLGLASTYEAAGKIDDAIAAYVRDGDLGAKSPYAPYAYYSAAMLYEQKGDKDNERRILTQVASLDPDSQFVKQAQYKLKQMTAAENPPIIPPTGVPPGANSPAAPSVPSPAPAAPTAPVPPTAK